MEARKLDELLGGAAAAGDVPGVVAMAADRDGCVYRGAFGTRELGKDAPMTEDTVFLIASMSKAVTGAAAMQLVEAGRLALDAPAGDVLPELAEVKVLDGFDGDTPRLRAPARPVTLRRLLTHTSGFCYEFWNRDLGRYQQAADIPSVLSGKKDVFQTPLMFHPGERWEYGMGIDWAGRMVEHASGQRLGDYLRENIFAPLGMNETAFTMSGDAAARLASVHARSPDGALAPSPLVLDQAPEVHMGGHGLYGTAGDYLRFTRALLNGGELDGQRILNETTVQTMGENHIGELEVPAIPCITPEFSNAVDFFPDMSKKWGLSFLINTEQTPQGRSANSLAWAGIANSYYWIDRSAGITGVLFTQILPFFDPKVVPLFERFEEALYDGLEAR